MKGSIEGNKFIVILWVSEKPDKGKVEIKTYRFGLSSEADRNGFLLMISSFFEIRARFKLNKDFPEMPIDHPLKITNFNWKMIDTFSSIYLGKSHTFEDDLELEECVWPILGDESSPEKPKPKKLQSSQQ
mmetsp:Transcript_29979/g.45842  ORF Transcript_29979/g.45842 Transcript_29979/m.45842 type:complete len:130 (+) Transcript_29979:460-849(+)